MISLVTYCWALFILFLHIYLGFSSPFCLSHSIQLASVDLLILFSYIIVFSISLNSTSVGDLVVLVCLT